MKTPFAPLAVAEPRRPRFLEGFAQAAAPAEPQRAFLAATQADGILQRMGAARNDAPHDDAPQAPAQAAPLVSRAQLAAEQAQRVSAAIERLELRGARLAEEARSDVLELAFALAKKIIEAELRSSPEALFSLVRAAVRRVGEARRIELRLSPQDAAVVHAALAENRAGLTTLTPVEIIADPSLQPGDCAVDSDAGLVDGRVDARMAEVRRAIEAAAEESAA
jgi:flagellar assembly protein FliH